MMIGQTHCTSVMFSVVENKELTAKRTNQVFPNPDRLAACRCSSVSFEDKFDSMGSVVLLDDKNKLTNLPIRI